MWRRWLTGRKTLASWPRTIYAARFSSTFSPHETISIPSSQTGGGHQLTLDIHHPTSAPPPSRSTPLTILIYLPRGPLLSNGLHDASTISLLRSSLPWTIVQVNYDRLMGHLDGQYPAPIHNVLAAYDWCYENLLPNGGSQHARVIVCGELIGGGLASMLALTECKAGQPGIVAAALNNPVVDWVELDKTFGRAKTKHSIAPTNTWVPLEADLLSLRSRLFRKPGQYFDPFASPILFFRSAGADVPLPTPKPPIDDLEHLMLLEREEFFREQNALSALSNPIDSKINELSEKTTRRKPKASRRFPSAALKIRLPQFHISATASKPPSILEIQALEFSRQLKLSHARQNGQSAACFGLKALDDHERGEETSRSEVDAKVEQKVQLRTHQGVKRGLHSLGLWDDTAEGRGRVMNVVEWLRETFT